MSASALSPIIDVVEAAPLSGHRIALRFEDGKRGVYDVSALIGSGVFRALEDPLFFNDVHVEYGTATWPGASASPLRSFTITASPHRTHG